MADGVILDWNFTNWVTVILMAAIGFALVGLGIKAYQNRAGAAQPQGA